MDRKWLIFFSLLIVPSILAKLPARAIEIRPQDGQSSRQQQMPRISDSVGNIDLPLAHWLNLLGKNENCPENGIIDSNGLRSYGQYCFQLATFTRYSKKFGLAGQITDNDFQRTLVIKILQEPAGWQNWYTTITQKIGLPPIQH
jgi:hypothetical protein